MTLATSHNAYLVRPPGTTIDRVRTEGSIGSILEAALNGDSDAWTSIVERFSDQLWWITRGYRLDEHTAADVVQTVWIQLIRFGHQIQDPERLGAWLATCTRRECLRRVSPREVPSTSLEERPDMNQELPEEAMLDEEAIGAMLIGFAQLSEPDQRLLKLLCDVPPRSYQEIAALLGRPVGAIGPSRQRALDRLRAILKEQDR